MGEKRISLRHEGGLRFVATTGSGHAVAVDNAIGNTAPRPTELLLAAIAGCTAMDVVEILGKKRQTLAGYAVEVSGTQRETAPNVFTEIVVTHVVEGDVETELESQLTGANGTSTNECSAIKGVVLDPTNNLLSSKILNASVQIVPFGYSESINVNIGFTNPLLS